MIAAGPKSVPPPQIPLTFVGIALLTLGATLVWMLTGASVPLAVLHALILGVFLMTAMGLLYQFVPVVAMAQLQLPYAAFAHLGFAMAGTLCIVVGFARVDFALVRTGGALFVTGIAVQMLILGLTLRSRKSQAPAPAAGAALSLLWLVAAIVLGIVVAERLVEGAPPFALPQYHALVGLAGFFGTLITAVSFRLLRMFERVNIEARTPMLAVAVSAAAVVAVVGGYWGAYALLVAAVAVGVSVAAVALVRNPAYQRETLAYTAASSLGAIAAVVAYLTGETATAIALAVWFYVGTAVIGYLQRIVPFIWWIRRSHREGAARIPTLAQMNESKLGYLILALWLVSGALWLRTPGDRLAECVALGAWIALLVQLSRPFLLGRHPDRSQGKPITPSIRG